jgi:hypothetical protein
MPAACPPFPPGLSPGLTLLLDDEALRPLVRLVVAEVVEHLAERGVGGDRLAYSEKEAAAVLGLSRWQLRAERAAGKVAFCRVNKNVYYRRADLVGYLLRTRTEASV